MRDRSGRSAPPEESIFPVMNATVLLLLLMALAVIALKCRRRKSGLSTTRIIYSRARPSSQHLGTVETAEVAEPPACRNDAKSSSRRVTRSRATRGTVLHTDRFSMSMSGGDDGEGRGMRRRGSLWRLWGAKSHESRSSTGAGGGNQSRHFNSFAALQSHDHVQSADAEPAEDDPALMGFATHALMAAALEDREARAAQARRRWRWARQLVQSDPRRIIHDYLLPGDERGPLGYLRALGLTPRVPSANLAPHAQSSKDSGDVARGTSRFFSVWRPCNLDAVRMMIIGEATGKGLNIKGKSAKCGELSGFVPFVQIHEDAHKELVEPPTVAGARARVYYRTARARSQALRQLNPLLAEMCARAAAARAQLQRAASGAITLEPAEKGAALAASCLVQAELKLVDSFAQVAGSAYSGPSCWGVEMPERLLWEAYVARQPLGHEPGWSAGSGRIQWALDEPSTRPNDPPP